MDNMFPQSSGQQIRLKYFPHFIIFTISVFMVKYYPLVMVKYDLKNRNGKYILLILLSFMPIYKYKHSSTYVLLSGNNLMK